MTDIEPDEAQLAEWEAAAEERYKSLRAHIFVELGHVCSFPHIGKAADTAAGAVRGELVKVFVAYLAACDQRDRLAKRVDELEADRGALGPDAAGGISACACGAPAASAVGYRGESASAFQCVRCAVLDRRTPFFHRKLNSRLEWP